MQQYHVCQQCNVSSQHGSLAVSQLCLVMSQSSYGSYCQTCTLFVLKRCYCSLLSIERSLGSEGGSNNQQMMPELLNKAFSMKARSLKHHKEPCVALFVCSSQSGKRQMDRVTTVTLTHAPRVKYHCMQIQYIQYTFPGSPPPHVPQPYYYSMQLADLDRVIRLQLALALETRLSQIATWQIDRVITNSFLISVMSQLISKSASCICVNILLQYVLILYGHYEFQVHWSHFLCGYACSYMPLPCSI